MLCKELKIWNSMNPVASGVESRELLRDDEI